MVAQHHMSLDSELPWSWYYACPAHELKWGPRRVVIASEEFVVFRTAGGQLGVLHGRCVHMGAHLSRGVVAGEHLQCPLHGWEFDCAGRCVHIPASRIIPDFARVPCFPCAEMGGHIFFCNRAQTPFKVPFFEGKSPDDLLAARPFDYDASVPWYMAGANGFDLQHFSGAHDRTLIAEPVVDQPSPFARRIRATFAVTGDTFRDRLTRRFSGPQVTMTITSWCGTIVLVTAEFRRTTSYGMVCITPVDATHSRLRTIVWVPRSRGAMSRRLFDPINAAVRRWFIRALLRSDQERTDGIRYTPGTLIEADAVLEDYFCWLQRLVKNRPATSPETDDSFHSGECGV